MSTSMSDEDKKVIEVLQGGPRTLEEIYLSLSLTLHPGRIAHSHLLLVIQLMRDLVVSGEITVCKGSNFEPIDHFVWWDIFRYKFMLKDKTGACSTESIQG